VGVVTARKRRSLQLRSEKQFLQESSQPTRTGVGAQLGGRPRTLGPLGPLGGGRARRPPSWWLDCIDTATASQGVTNEARGINNRQFRMNYWHWSAWGTHLGLTLLLCKLASPSQTKAGRNGRYAKGHDSKSRVHKQVCFVARRSEHLTRAEGGQQQQQSGKGKAGTWLQAGPAADRDATHGQIQANPTASPGEALLAVVRIEPTVLHSGVAPARPSPANEAQWPLSCV
jgi:hypothetical protein